MSRHAASHARPFSIAPATSGATFGSGRPRSAASRTIMPSARIASRVQPRSRSLARRIRPGTASCAPRPILPSAVDPNIKWESTRSNNFGFDFGLFSQRLTGTFDFYDKHTDDLIFRVHTAAGTNFSNYVTTNIGSMKNNGIEFMVSARVLEGQGNGHGVGMCQWGAVGRARAGYSAEQILSAYYSGAMLSRVY